MKKDRFPCDDIHKPGKIRWINNGKQWICVDAERRYDMLLKIYNPFLEKELEVILGYNKPVNHDPMFGDVNRKK